MSTEDPEAAVLPLAAVPPGTPLVGWLVAWDPEHGPRVDFPGNRRGPLSARSTVAMHRAAADEAIATRRGLVLVFEAGRLDLPIVTGVLVEGPTVAARLPAGELEATVDGQRVRIEGSEEIVLRCGNASIVLRSNGRVIIRGTYVETRSSGTNRIKGGSVQIN